MNLSELKIGSKAKVVTVDCENPLRRRLLDMGITPGTEIMVVGAAPFGDPLQLRLRGFDLALRKEDAANIAVERVRKTQKKGGAS